MGKKHRVAPEAGKKKLREVQPTELPSRCEKYREEKHSNTVDENYQHAMNATV